MSILNVVDAKVWGSGEQYVYDMCDELHRRQILSFVFVDASNQELQHPELSQTSLTSSIGTHLSMWNHLNISVQLTITHRTQNTGAPYRRG